MPNLIACGCSWTVGSYTEPSNDSKIWRVNKNNSYANQLPMSDISIWAQNGVSNYAIACQVTDAIKIKPDFILFNTTTTSRYDISRPEFKTWCLGGDPWRSEQNDHTLQFKNEYRKGTWPTPTRQDFYDHSQNPQGTIISKNLSMFGNYAEHPDDLDFMFTDYEPGFTHTDSQTVTDYHTMYSDWGIKHHTDIMIVNSTIRDLEVSGIPWICVDITGIAPDHHRIHKIDLISMLSNHGMTHDPAHWNQSGHNDLAQDLQKKYF